MLTASALVALAAQIAPLADLKGYPPVALRISALLEALRGNEGITAREVRLMRVWAQKWSRLNPKVRAFYAEYAETEEGSAALDWLLNATRPAPDPLRWQVSKAWTERHGASSPYDLLPNLWSTK